MKSSFEENPPREVLTNLIEGVVPFLPIYIYMLQFVFLQYNTNRAELELHKNSIF